MLFIYFFIQEEFLEILIDFQMNYTATEKEQLMSDFAVCNSFAVLVVTWYLLSNENGVVWII